MISDYAFIVFEHPALPGGLLTVENTDRINNFTNYTGLFMVSGQLGAAQGKKLGGVEFRKHAGSSFSDKNSTVNISDPFFTFDETAGKSTNFELLDQSNKSTLDY